MSSVSTFAARRFPFGRFLASSRLLPVIIGFLSFQTDFLSPNLRRIWWETRVLPHPAPEARRSVYKRLPAPAGFKRRVWRRLTFSAPGGGG